MNSNILKGKNIILGISGGIAAYKSVVLLRLLVKAGCDVQVVITPNGKQFITPVTLSALSKHPVVSEFFTANTGQWNSHVDLGLWADAMVIAPATASTIAKMANGVADNMLITTYLSSKAPVFIAPAMDLDMMAHPSTTRNLELLRSYGNHIIEAAEGALASDLTGKGRMQEPEVIVKHLANYFEIKANNDLSLDWLRGKKVLITAGPTHEPIDPVRFIGNNSTGKMGFALADAAASVGAEVTVVTGPVSVIPGNQTVKTVPVTTALQMLQKTTEIAPDADIIIFAAAVADYRPEVCQQHKIKRENIDKAQVCLVRNPDIAATVSAQKKRGQLCVGFALETDNELANARRKLTSKHLDAIVLNSLRDKGAGFGCDTNKVTILSADGNDTEIPLMAKAEIAKHILQHLCEIKTAQAIPNI